MTATTKSLFRAIKAKPDKANGALFADDLPDQVKPETRDPLDYDPTPADATAAFLAAEGERIRQIGGPIWEPAVGGGHIANELIRHEFDVIGNDVVDRGWPGTFVRSFYDYRSAPSQIMVTNPPYNEVSARDGHGRWLRHCQGLGLAILRNASQLGLDCGPDQRNG